MSHSPAFPTSTDPQTRVLLAILENQLARTAACLEGLTSANLDAAPGGDCQSIRGILAHLLDLRGFQLFLLQSPLQAQMPKVAATATLAEITAALDHAAGFVRQAIQSHDPNDWFAVPAQPRQGPWGSDPTLVRFSRPLNDFTNHLGAIRALRRIFGNPAGRTQ